MSDFTPQKYALPVDTWSSKDIVFKPYKKNDRGGGSVYHNFHFLRLSMYRRMLLIHCACKLMNKNSNILNMKKIKNGTHSFIWGAYTIYFRQFHHNIRNSEYRPLNGARFAAAWSLRMLVR